MFYLNNNDKIQVQTVQSKKYTNTFQKYKKYLPKIQKNNNIKQFRFEKKL